MAEERDGPANGEMRDHQLSDPAAGDSDTDTAELWPHQTCENFEAISSNLISGKGT